MDTPKQANRAILVISVLVLIGGSFLLFYSRSHSRTTPLYQGKHFESWFYGGRTNFFAQETQTAAQKAFWDLTTNAFPFLLDTLNHNRGSGRIYLKTYRTMPTPVQALLPYPILSDDIRFRTWDLIWQMPLLTIDEP